VHGGWFNLGSASGVPEFRRPHRFERLEPNAFVPDYRLAPEHPFPAAVEDVEACYRGLVDEGISKIAVTGDSAGGDLALVLLSDRWRASPDRRYCSRRRGGPSRR